jgi:hypothetical protein
VKEGLDGACLGICHAVRGNTKKEDESMNHFDPEGGPKLTTPPA